MFNIETKNLINKKLFQILIHIEDVAYDPTLARQSTMLHSLHVAGHHDMISAVFATHKLNAIFSSVRDNGTLSNYMYGAIHMLEAYRTQSFSCCW